MAVKIGFLDKAGHPHIKIRVWGLSADFGREFEAMIDTGFSGYLSIPLVQAFPLALTLFGTTQYELADGSMSPKLLAHGSIDHEGGSDERSDRSGSKCQLRSPGRDGVSEAVEENAAAWTQRYFLSG